MSNRTKESRMSSPAASPVESSAFEPAFDDFVPSDAVLGAYERSVETLRARDQLVNPLLGKVVRLDRGFPLVQTCQGSVRAEHAIALVKDGSFDMRACVGDWVVLDIHASHDHAMIEHILPRATQFSRWDGSSWGTRQVLASHIDTVCVVQALSHRQMSCERIVRAVVLAHQGACTPLVVLTKADRCVDGAQIEKFRCLVEVAVGTDIGVLVLSAHDGRGLDELRRHIPPGHSALLLGESGAGKSSLVNALAGLKLLEVASVRSRDDRGRHTTVSRRMVKIPHAGVVVDAPGLRSLSLLDEDAGLAATFPEICARLEQCRFRDCTHTNEPGCAVLEGVADGDISAERLELFRILSAEMHTNRCNLDPAAQASVTR